jgi:hypothetical protein
MNNEEKQHPKPEADSTPATYKVKVDDTILTVSTPEPAGQLLLEMMGLDPRTYFLVQPVQGKPDVMIEADDTLDLTAPGIEQVSVVTRRKQYAFRIDEERFVLENPNPTGRELLALVEKAPCRYALVQVIAHSDDQFIDPEEQANLRLAGTEQFNTVLKDDVTVFVEHDGETHSVQVRRGKVAVATIKGEANVPDGFTLYTNDGPPMPLEDQGFVNIEGCENFVTQVNSGGSS